MINLTPCLVYEAVCYLQQRFFPQRKWMKPEQIALIEELNEKFADKLCDDCIGMSTMCSIIDHCGENVEYWTLDDLISALSDMDSFSRRVKANMKSEWIASYHYPVIDCLAAGASSVLISDLTVLRDGGFEDFYRERILPGIKENIVKKKVILNNENIDVYLDGIARLKGADRLTDITVYVSYMSYPTAFTMYRGFLTVMSEAPMAQLLGHELMHGFSSSDVTELYRSAVQSNDFLIEQHRRLIEDFHSGDEEEMVMAAEYYLAYQAGKSVDVLRPEAKNRYGSSCPISAMIFLELIKEKEPITDYNGWLREYFTRTDFSSVSPDLSVISDKVNYDKF